MHWKDIQQLPPGQFQRLTGVKRPTFDQMVLIVQEHIRQVRKHPKRGKPPKLQLEDQLLMMLM
jgi:SpoVK/Ycf46/Vps4 family AAA+-type ATPase